MSIRDPDPTNDAARLRAPREHEIDALVACALSDQPPSRRPLIAAPVREALVRAVGSPARETLVLESAAARGVVVATRAGDAAQILAIGATPAAPPTLARRALVAAHDALERAGVRFVHTMRSPEGSQGPFSSCGYEPVATLDYLIRDRAVLPRVHERAEMPGPSEASPLCFEPLKSADLSEIAQVTEATYSDTLDCPGLSRMRSPLETLRGYQRAEGYDPRCWFVARLGDQPVGCVITTPHASAGILELTYMGLIPQARGRRLGRPLLARACRQAELLGLREVVLAVDQRNAPARRLYRWAGFERLMSERSWCRNLGRSVPADRLRRAG